MYNKQPIILVSGDGACGKSTLCKMISSMTSLRYFQSTSGFATEGIFHDISSGNFDPQVTPDAIRQQRGYHDYVFPANKYATPEDCYNDRSNHRLFWAWWIDRLNRQDPQNIGLYRLAMEAGANLLDGIRKQREFEAMRPFCDLSIWINKPGIPRDPTQQYGPESCDLIVTNHPDDLNRTRTSIERIFRGLKFMTYGCTVLTPEHQG